MANISTLSTISTAASALSNLILVSPQATVGYQPQPPPSTNPGNPLQQPPALLFNYEGEQTVRLESDITDHYVEDNTAIQDQIALKPEEITTHGFIGELNTIPRGFGAIALAALQFVADKLTVVSAYAPALSTTALIAYNEAFFAYQQAQNLANAATSAWNTITSNSGAQGESVIGSSGLITSEANQTQQQVYFQQFYQYWRDRTLFTVQTPWCVFENMAIKSLRAIQDADTNVITDFELTFKMIRFSDTGQSSTLNPAYMQTRANAQASSLTNTGTNSAVAGPSLTSKLPGK